MTATEGVAVVLQRRLVDECADRDEGRRQLQLLSRTVRYYQLKLQALVGGASDAALAQDRAREPPIASAARELVRAFQAEVHGAAVSDEVWTSRQREPLASSARVLANTAAARHQSFEVLRHSLDEAHRRAESLNCDMAHQTEANEELVETLATVKDANKRLLEQIRFQTDEITQLTSQRIGVEENMDQLARAHQADKEAFRQEWHGQLSALREHAAEQYTAVQRQLTDKLKSFRTKLELVARDAAGLAEGHRRLKGDVTTLEDNFRGQLRNAEHAAGAQALATMDSHSRWRASAAETANDLERRINAERDLRQEEALSWGQKHTSLSADIDDKKARLSRDLSQLTPQLQAFQRTMELEQQAWQEEKARLSGRINDVKAKRQTKQEDLDKLHVKLNDLESTLGSLGVGRPALEKGVIELRAQVRESDDSLAAAVSGNEHLRSQLEEQRTSFQEKNETDLNDCRVSFERKLGQADSAREADGMATQKLLLGLEERLQSLQDASKATHSQVDGTNAEIESLQEALASWRSRFDGDRTRRQALEADSGDCRQRFASERLRLQAVCESLSACSNGMDDDIVRTREHLEDFQRVASARETDHETRYAAALVVLREVQEQADVFKQRYDGVAEACRNAEEETATKLRLANEAEARLRGEIEQRKKAVAEERSRMERELDAEKKAAENVQKELDRERSSSSSELRRTQEEGRSRLEAIAAEKSRVEGSYKSELANKIGVATQQQKRCETLEFDVNRLRHLLQESEANSSWVRQELEREDREGSIGMRQLEDELWSVQTQLDKAVRDEAALTRQLEEATESNTKERKRLNKDLEDIKHSAAVEQADAEGQWQRARSKYQLELRSVEDRRQGAAGLDRSFEERMHRDSGPLQDLFAVGEFAQPRPAGESYARVGALSALHTQLESQIQRLQRHTEHLRSNLQCHEITDNLMSKRTLEVSTAAPATSSLLSSPLRSGDPLGRSSMSPTRGMSSPLPATSSYLAAPALGVAAN
eukprot:TRINITY_DN90463_c0_g1_i1.p1 TRINITY_DN90463_c0_g1~~TRINITY_DN90463_c0_g1_i1.p1  ORF type:complete len:1002 (+),score=294.33 TRINITY_DN90463_c0_g1_i1:41-3046(+)